MTQPHPLSYEQAVANVDIAERAQDILDLLVGGSNETAVTAIVVALAGLLSTAAPEDRTWLLAELTAHVAKIMNSYDDFGA